MNTARWIRISCSVCAALLVARPAAVITQSPAPLQASEVATILNAAMSSLADDGMAAAVVDRTGAILGVLSRGADAAGPDRAVSLARTGALFSNDRAPLSSRTVRFIGGIHFPPGVANAPNGPLYGVENTNRGCQLDARGDAIFNVPLAPTRSIEGTFGPTGAGEVAAPTPCRPSDTRGCSPGVTTGKPDARDNAGLPLDVPVDPGGLPLYRAGVLIGGVGVAGVPPSHAEYAAARASVASGGITTALSFPDPLPSPGAVYLDGVRLPFFSDCTTSSCVTATLSHLPAGARAGSLDGVTTVVAPRAGGIDPSGYLIGPFGSIAAGGLTLDEVTRAVAQAVARADVTRAQLRLPAGQSTRMAIGISDSTGRVLAVYRMPDTTFFSVDVAATKARNVYYFSSREGYEVLRQYLETNPYADYRWEPEPPAGQGWAMTNRTIGFGSQPLFPPGIDSARTATPGPWFDLLQYDTQNACTEGPGSSRGGNRSFANQSGIVWFAGSAPLYRGDQLIGGVGISGDGVDQDDYVAAAAVAGFEPPAQLRADRSEIVAPDGRRTRLPYAKFPRNPEIR
jgi:uncharacterized protein GlcG (DUF336 family)